MTFCGLTCGVLRGPPGFHSTLGLRRTALEVEAFADAGTPHNFGADCEHKIVLGELWTAIIRRFGLKGPLAMDLQQDKKVEQFVFRALQRLLMGIAD